MSTHQSPGTCCVPPRAAPTGTVSASSPQSTMAPYLPVSFLRCLRKHTFSLTIEHKPWTGPLSLTWQCVSRSVRFSPPGSVSVPRCDRRHEESSVHRAQSPRSYQQLSIRRLPDMSPAHSHQVNSLIPPFMTRGLCKGILNCRFSIS